jgi:hypothetical protein
MLRVLISAVDAEHFRRYTYTKKRHILFIYGLFKHTQVLQSQML